MPLAGAGGVRRPSTPLQPQRLRGAPASSAATLPVLGPQALSGGTEGANEFLNTAFGDLSFGPSSIAAPFSPFQGLFPQLASLLPPQQQIGDLPDDVTPGESVRSGASAPSATGRTHNDLPLANYSGQQFQPQVIPSIQNIVQQFPGLQVSGGYRAPARNREVNGVSNSYHLSGLAVDLSRNDLGSGEGAELRRVAAWVDRNGSALGVRSTLVHDAGSGLHLHISFRGSHRP